MPGSLSNEDEGQDDMDFEDDMPDDDDEGERNTVPLTPLDSFFSDSDSLKQQKKQKPKKMKEGKMPKVKKRKKEMAGIVVRKYSDCAKLALGVRAVTDISFQC
ncbi:hypothetical protein JOQ06_026677 [Pogonophryne albipinna]|uniref:Uncharacterized protein n=1 Tax=Pogonophryne albipinna TaxID=1090488 RepID=A0AAD6BCM9_9TELE|nr:hypothetical protein JOQ06_026677 [Pogonophryne albipinna]